MHPGSAGQFEAARDTPDYMGAGREIRRAGGRPDVGQAQACGQVVTGEQNLHFLDVGPDRRVAGADFPAGFPGRL
jgi:hypothetical protein